MASEEPKWKVPKGDLAPPDETAFEFVPDVGFKFVGDGRSVILHGTSITKAGVQFDDNELFDYASTMQRYLDAIKGLPDQTYEHKKCIFTDKDFLPYGSKYAYKFVTEDTYERFISNGAFLLSSLGRFRDFEDQGDPAGDRFEGMSHCAYAVGDRELKASTLSGFDMHIFSLARDLKTAEEMKSKFGPVVLRVRLLPFARALARILGESPAEVRLIRYADLKLYRGHLSLSKVAGFPPALSPRLAKALRQRGRFPSVFAKPSRFEAEREVRIAIRAASDVPRETVIKQGSLLKHVERIKG